MLVNYVSNHPLNRALGGWDAVSSSIHQVLSQYFQMNFVGPINPHDDYRAKLVSKLRRTGGLAGSFHFFSKQRLQSIARDVERGVDKSADCDFFHGPTPWINCVSPRPYFVYTDTCFSTYINTYHDREQFLEKDLQRIFETESRWLAGAAGVFFGTRWALDQAAKDYSLPRHNLMAVGAAGSLPIPEQDVYRGGLNFLFIAYDFQRKGGPICAAAFEKVRSKFPETTLTIVGGRPPEEVIAMRGVEYLGLLRKTIPAELDKLRELYATSLALVHPTSSDIQPLVICEAGYHGCPTIAANSFGIPELVVDGVTGILLDTPLTAEVLAQRMKELCEHSVKYRAMREAVRSHTTANLTWDRVGARIAAEMKLVMGVGIRDATASGMMRSSA